MKAILLLVAPWLVLAAPDDKEKLREALKDSEPQGRWIYDDLQAGLSEARASNRPLLVVLRCVPCVTFKGFDRQVARRDDPELAALMDKFVCVRLVQAYGLDLSLFQYDWDLNWSCVLMNADRTIYGRYGSKTGEKGNAARVTLEGLRKALEAALGFHAGYPANRRDFEGKAARPGPWATPEAIPGMKRWPNAVPADGSRAKCLHCHMIHEAELWTLREQDRPIPDSALWPYPMPDVVGLSLDLKECATVKAVAPGSAAEQGGFQVGDSIRRLGGQPILSVADIQWVLHQAPEPSTLDAEVDRAGRTARASIALAAGWRRKDDFTWRTQVWGMRHRLLGTQPLERLSPEDRKSAGLPADGLAVRIKGFPPDFVRERNRQASQAFEKNDLIVAVDGHSDLEGESGLLGYLMRRKPGQSVVFTVLRGAERRSVDLSIP